MKKCPYCGREYSNEAKVCVVDQHELIDPNNAPSRDGGAATAYFLYRLGVGILIGMIVASISILVGWEDAKNLSFADEQQYATRSTLAAIQDAIRQYQKNFGALPKSLAEVPEITNTVPTQLGQPVDGWKRPLMYSTTGTQWVVQSYGRDGRPGGVGLDGDLSSDAPYPKSANLTLGQFFQAPRCRKMILTSVLCGLLSFGLTSLTVKKPPTTRMGVIGLLAALGLTAFAAIVVASVITILHIPSGH
jgi:general secretion pathway protein G